MGYDSLFGRQELFVAAACVGAHAQGTDGFRQRDVKFLADLFINWTESTLHRGEVVLRNTQIQRYLISLASEGYARQITKKNHPLYRLTRTGLLELLSRVALQPQLGRGARFFFVYYFLKNYRERLVALIAEEGKQFPPALRLEVEATLDIGELLSREVLHTEKELQKLRNRIADAAAASSLTTDLRKKKVEFSEIVRTVQREYPYELNSQKPLSELIGSIPEEARGWELEIGNRKRIEDMWEPEQKLLECYKAEIEALQKKNYC